MKITPLGGQKKPQAFQLPVQSPAKAKPPADRTKGAEQMTPRSGSSTVTEGHEPLRTGDGLHDNSPATDAEKTGSRQMEALALREVSMADGLSRKGIVLRPFLDEDLPQILEIAAANFVDRFGKSITVPKEALSRFLSDFGFVSARQQPGYFVADDRGRILGFLLLRRPSDPPPGPTLGLGKRTAQHGLDATLKGTLLRLLTDKGINPEETIIENLEIRRDMLGKGILAALLGKAREVAADDPGCSYLSLALPEKDTSGQAIGEALHFKHDYTHSSLVGMAFLGLPVWTYLRMPLAEEEHPVKTETGLLKTWLRRRKKLWWLGFLGFITFFKFPDMIGTLSGEESSRTFIHLLWLWYLRYLLPKRP